MIVDIETMIERGRVWYVHPRPDDLVLADEGLDPHASQPAPLTLSPLPFLKPFNPTRFPKLEDLREGYPWQAPPRRTVHLPPSNFDLFTVTGLGLRWTKFVK